MKLPRILILSLFLVGIAYSDEPRIVNAPLLFDSGPVDFIDTPSPLAFLEKERNPLRLFQPKLQGTPVWSSYPDAPLSGPGTYPSGTFKLDLWGHIDLSDKEGRYGFELPLIPHANRFLRRDDTYQMGQPLIGGTRFPSGTLWSDRVVYPFTVKGSSKPVGAFVMDRKTGKIDWLVTDLPQHEEERYLIKPKQTLAMKLLNDSIPVEEVLKAIEAGDDINKPVNDDMLVLKRSRKESTPMITAWDAQDGLRWLEQFPAIEGARAHSLPNFCFYGKGMTPLASALVSCRADLVTLLLERGANRDAQIDFVPQDCAGFTQYKSETIGLQKLMDLREEAAKDYYFSVKGRDGLSAGAEVKERWVSCNETNKAFANYVKSKTGSFTIAEETDGRESVILRSKKNRGAVDASSDPTAIHKGASAASGDPTPRPRYSEEEQAELARLAKIAADKKAAEEAKAAAEETAGREEGLLRGKKK